MNVQIIPESSVVACDDHQNKHLKSGNRPT